MNEQSAVQSFVKRWLNNPKFKQWGPHVEFAKLTEGTRREFYEKGHNRLRSMAWEMFTDIKIGADVREQMCWIMAVGLWEKERRQKEAEEKVRLGFPDEWLTEQEKQLKPQITKKLEMTKEGQVVMDMPGLYRRD